MRPEYWIGIMAVIGAVLGYAVYRTTGWLDSGIGAAVGILKGIIIYARLKGKSPT